MDELTQLANALMALDDKLAACMKCGFCQAFCPMYIDATRDRRRRSPAARSRWSRTWRIVIIRRPGGGERKAVPLPAVRRVPVQTAPRACRRPDIFTGGAGHRGGLSGIVGRSRRPLSECLLPNPRRVRTRCCALSSPFQNLHPEGRGQVPRNTACAPLLKTHARRPAHAASWRTKPLRSARSGRWTGPRAKSRMHSGFLPRLPMGDKIYTGVSEACLKVFELP